MVHYNCMTTESFRYIAPIRNYASPTQGTTDSKPAPVIQPAAASVSDEDRLKYDVTALQQIIPNELGLILNNSLYSPEHRIELARELARYNQKTILSENDVASASPEIRAGLQQIKEYKDYIQAQEQALLGMAAAPLLAVATLETARVNNLPEQNLAVALQTMRGNAEEEWRRQNNLRNNVVPAAPTVTFAAAAEALGSGNELLGGLAPITGLPNLKGGAARGGNDLA